MSLDSPRAGAPKLLHIFAAAPPGLESHLGAELKALAAEYSVVRGGVEFLGDWPQVWRANLWLRCASRVLVRVGEFRAMHLAQLDKRTRRLPWRDFLDPHHSVSVEVTCRRSKIYHSGAATERIARALTETLNVDVQPEATIRILGRIDDDLCTISIDTSGDPLHKRGYKLEVGKAPLRENIAAAFLRACGYSGDEPFVDPMCGSGTLVIEAAQIAAHITPGALRPFAFQSLPSYHASAWQKIQQASAPQTSALPALYGSDRDAGAISASARNAERAGVSEYTRFSKHAISDLRPPSDEPGLVLTNPPYGHRIGDVKKLRNLYATFGRVLRERFAGWRVGMITSDRSLAHATGLPFKPPGSPVPHGGTRVQLYQTNVLS